MPENQVTIVVVPRERFSLTRDSLRSQAFRDFRDS